MPELQYSDDDSYPLHAYFQYTMNLFVQDGCTIHVLQRIKHDSCCYYVCKDFNEALLLMRGQFR